MTKIQISAQIKEKVEELILSQNSPQFPIVVPGTPFLIFDTKLEANHAQDKQLFFIGKITVNQQDYQIYQSIKKTA